MGLIVSCFEKERICYEQLVKTEQLIVGNIYTYKELCQLFEEPEKTSDSRVAQKKEWARYFSWSNPTKRKYKIEGIYETFREKQDGRKGNGGNCTSKYLSLDNRIMFCMEQREHMCCTISCLLTAAELLSEEYMRNRWNHKEYDNTEWSAGVVNHVFWRIDTIVINAGKSSLERLKRDGYLVVLPRIVLVNQNKEKIWLSEIRTQMVEEILRRVREEMELKPNELYKPESRREYEAKVKEYIERELKEQIAYYYRVYDITKTEKEYFYKTEESVGVLTQKFVKAICISMLKVDYGEGFYTRNNIAVQTVRLLARQFVHMKPENWNEYFSSMQGDKMNEEEAVVFWKYYVPYINWLENEKRKEKNEYGSRAQEQSETGTKENDLEKRKLEWLLEQADLREQEEKEEECRKEAVDYFGEKKTKALEKIVPNLSWRLLTENASEDSPYWKYVSYFLDSFNNVVSKTVYVRDKAERIKMIERVMNESIKDYKLYHGGEPYGWLKNLETKWSIKGIEI